MVDIVFSMYVCIYMHVCECACFFYFTLQYTNENCWLLQQNMFRLTLAEYNFFLNFILYLNLLFFFHCN